MPTRRLLAWMTRSDHVGFEQGGMIIGQLERALIFILTLTGQAAGIGFLIAAKSILRYGEAQDPSQRMDAEYIIIGTLMSFGWGILVSYLTLVMPAASLVPPNLPSHISLLRNRLEDLRRKVHLHPHRNPHPH